MTTPSKPIPQSGSPREQFSRDLRNLIHRWINEPDLLPWDYIAILECHKLEMFNLHRFWIEQSYGAKPPPDAPPPPPPPGQ